MPTSSQCATCLNQDKGTRLKAYWPARLPRIDNGTTNIALMKVSLFTVPRNKRLASIIINKSQMLTMMLALCTPIAWRAAKKKMTKIGPAGTPAPPTMPPVNPPTIKPVKEPRGPEYRYFEINRVAAKRIKTPMPNLTNDGSISTKKWEPIDMETNKPIATGPNSGQWASFIEAGIRCV